MVNIISIADSGKGEKSTGHIYYYLTDLDYTANDIKAENKITFMISEDQDLSCTKSSTDPMEPTCARVIISGKVIALNNSTEEYKKAKAAFISRHPAANRWIQVHSFFLCTVDILNIFVLDWYGGPHKVSPEDYYKVPSE
ncbi:unnamed protein product [Hermetia illucens]|uniref:CREG-like beta-barrel domain-containing protein n=2 Tax=Hermetia illucens TaxID=343691 RepID=A0A7R8UNQ4_HERIL|nr:unnamed protein product [Hermetia illucens]